MSEPIRGRLKRRWLYIPFLIAALVMVAYWFAWRTGANEIKNGVTNWAADQARLGIEVNYDEMIADGFPFFLRVHIENPRITLPDGTHWNTQRVSIDALPYQLDRMVFSTQSDHFLLSPDFDDMRLRAPLLRASIRTDRQRGWVFSLQLEDTAVTMDADGSAVTLGGLIADLGPDSGDPDAFVVSLILTDAQVLDAARIDKLSTVFGLTHLSSLSNSGAYPQSLRHWAEAGGKFIVNGFTLEADKGIASAAGSITLDQHLYLNGNLRTEIKNPAALTALLHDVGLVADKQNADIIGANLTLASIAGGGKLVAPIVIDGGIISIVGTEIAKTQSLSAIPH